MLNVWIFFPFCYLELISMNLLYTMDPSPNACFKTIDEELSAL